MSAAIGPGAVAGGPGFHAGSGAGAAAAGASNVTNAAASTGAAISGHGAGGNGGWYTSAQAAAVDARKTGLWVFMAVVCSLFMLFGIAYLMRMAMADWRPLRYVPWQLWLSTLVLAAASAAWEAARRRPGYRLAQLACVLSLLFLLAQLWAWQAMAAMHFTVGGNPANSFFYLLTGLHGVHVAGGLVAAVLAGAAVTRQGGPARGAQGRGGGGSGNGHGGGEECAGRGGRGVDAGVAMLLCARYWHFLLLLWLALFALLFLVTPDLVQVVCESVGIRPPAAR